MSEVTVHGGAGGLAQSIQANGHSWTADEPIEVGGTGMGPGPYELLLASLGACTSMTLRLYANRKGWKLTGITVRLRHDKIHAEDCRNCETKEGKIDRIFRELTLEGDLDESQRQRLLEISERCPVARTLQSEIRIETRLES